MSWTSGTAPAIEVSATPAFRGGGGDTSRVSGLCAAVVTSLRLEDNRMLMDEVKVRAG